MWSFLFTFRILSPQIIKYKNHLFSLIKSSTTIVQLVLKCFGQICWLFVTGGVGKEKQRVQVSKRSHGWVYALVLCCRYCFQESLEYKESDIGHRLFIVGSALSPLIQSSVQFLITGFPIFVNFSGLEYWVSLLLKVTLQKVEGTTQKC